MNRSVVHDAEVSCATARIPRWAVTGVIIVTLLGGWIRWGFLDHPMRYDESYNYLHYASKSPTYIVTHYVPNNHILHTLMVHASSRVFGSSPAALRLPAFLAGVVLIPAVAWLGWVIGRRGVVAVFSSLAVCGSSALIEYSVNARGYSLLALATVVCTTWMIGLWDAPRRRSRWIALGVAAGVGAYTVPVMVLPFAGIAMLLLVRAIQVGGPIRTNWMVMVATAGVGTAVFYLPVVWVGGASALSGSGQMAYEVLGKQIATFTEMVREAWNLWCRHGGSALPMLFGLSLIYFVIQTVRARTPRHLTPLLVVMISLALAGVMDAPMPARTWVFALPVLLVCALCGLLRVESGRGGRLRKIAGSLAAVTLVCLPLMRVPWMSRLCSEPGGLVEVDEALAECHEFGIERCTVIAPYNPATAYYMQQRGIDVLLPADAPQVERVVLVTSPQKSLAELWSDRVSGHDRFGDMNLVRTLPSGALHQADCHHRMTLNR